MVVFFDIDGTIVDEETQIIPESAVRAVEQLQKKGHIPVINTGRPYTHIDPRVRDMAFSGWICGCGMEVCLNGEWLYRVRPEPEVCRITRDLVRSCGMQVLYEAGDGAILTDGKYSDGHPTAVREVARMKAKGFEIREIDRSQPRFMKLVTFDAPGCRREEFIREMERYFTVIDRGNTMLELMMKGCSKAGGMQRLLKHLGLERDQTLAIGDSTNDLPMFSAAGHTACMGDGMKQLQEKSEFITAPVLEDGVEKALRHFGLI